MALQDTIASRDADTPNVQILVNGQQQQAQHSLMSMGHDLVNFGNNENAQANVRVSIIPAMMQSPPSIVSSHMTPLQATPTMSSETTPSVHSMVLQTPKEDHCQREQERRIRREIANSNERRRMQSINAGFKSLKSILPHTEGEKLSKAAILQQTSDYISQLEADKIRLLQQIDKLKRALTECKCNPTKHMALADIFEKDEGIGSPAEEDYEDMKRGISEVKQQLDKERRLRMILEQQIQNMDVKYADGMQAATSMNGKDNGHSVVKSLSNELVGVKTQQCARTLLPALAPLNFPRYEPQIQSASTSSQPRAGIMTPKIDTGLPVTGRVAVSCEKGIDVIDGGKGAISSPQSDHLITVFSHSNKSNQPLKKRAIEIMEIMEVQHNVADSGCEANMEQPKSKVPKMSVEHLTKNEADILIPSADPTALDSPLLHPSVKLASLPSEPRNIVTPKAQMSLPALPLSLPDPKVHFPPLTSSSGLQGLPNTLYKTIPHCSLPSDGATFSKTTPTPLPEDAEKKNSQIPCKLDNIPAQSGRAPLELVTFVNSAQEGQLQGSPIPGPVYFTVNGGSNIAYVQQDADKPVSMPTHYQHPQYIVAPINNGCNGLVVSANGITQNGNGMQLMSQQVAQSQSLHTNVPPAIVAYPPPPVSQPCVTLPLQVSQPFALVQNNASPSHYTIRSKPLQNLQTGTLLCYSQPEITLNQLNAVPNLAPPKSLHQPVMSGPVGSPLVPTAGSESPYMMPNVHENSLQSKVNAYISPAAIRCRNSSLSAADSCSTASASGAEEEDVTIKTDMDSSDPQQLQRSLGKASTSMTASSGPSPAKSILSESCGVAAYDEVANESATKSLLSDSMDSTSSPRAKTLSVLTTVTTSPPVIRRINSMQSRGNLETIVQAIDHLEQQERRNSQDQPEIVS